MQVQSLAEKRKRDLKSWAFFRCDPSSHTPTPTSPQIHTHTHTHPTRPNHNPPLLLFPGPIHFTRLDDRAPDARQAPAHQEQRSEAVVRKHFFPVVRTTVTWLLVCVFNWLVGWLVGLFAGSGGGRALVGSGGGLSFLLDLGSFIRSTTPSSSLTPFLPVLLLLLVLQGVG